MEEAATSSDGKEELPNEEENFGFGSGDEESLGSEDEFTATFNEIYGQDSDDENTGGNDGFLEETQISSEEESEMEEEDPLEKLAEEVLKNEKEWEEENKRLFSEEPKQGAKRKRTYKAELRNCGYVLASDCVSSSMHFSGNYVDYPRGAIGALKDTTGNYAKIGSLYKDQKDKIETFANDVYQDHPISFRLCSKKQIKTRKSATNDLSRLKNIVRRTKRSELVQENVDILNRNVNLLGEGNTSICTYCGCSHERNLAVSCHTKFCEEITNRDWNLKNTGDFYTMDLEMLATIFGLREEGGIPVVVPDGTFGYYEWARRVDEKIGPIFYRRNRSIKQYRYIDGIRKKIDKCKPEIVERKRTDLIAELSTSKMINKDEKRSEEPRAIACFSFHTMAWQVASELSCSSRTTLANESGNLKNEEANSKVEDITEKVEIEFSRSTMVRTAYITTDCTKYNNAINMFEMAFHTVLKTLDTSLEVALLSVFSHAFCGPTRTIKSPSVPIKKNGITLTQNLAEVSRATLRNPSSEDFWKDFKRKLPPKERGIWRGIDPDWCPFYKHRDALWMVLLFSVHCLKENTDYILDLGMRMGMGVFNQTATSSQELRITKNHEMVSEGLLVVLNSYRGEITTRGLKALIKNLSEEEKRNPEVFSESYNQKLINAERLGQGARHRLWYTGKSDDGYQILAYPKTFENQAMIDLALHCMETSNRIVSDKKSVGTFSGDGNLYSSPITAGRVYAVPSKHYNSFLPMGKNPITDEENLNAVVCNSLREQVPTSVVISHLEDSLGHFQGVWKNEFPEERNTKEATVYNLRAEQIGLRKEIRPMVLNGLCCTTLETCHSGTLVTRFALTKTIDEEALLFDTKAEEPLSTLTNDRGVVTTETSTLYKALASFNTKSRIPKRSFRALPIDNNTKAKINRVMLDLATFNRTSKRYGEILFEMCTKLKHRQGLDFLAKFGYSSVKRTRDVGKKNETLLSFRSRLLATATKRKKRIGYNEVTKKMRLEFGETFNEEGMNS